MAAQLFLDKSLGVGRMVLVHVKWRPSMGPFLCWSHHVLVVARLDFEWQGQPCARPRACLKVVLVIVSGYKVFVWLVVAVD